MKKTQEGTTLVIVLLLLLIVTLLMLGSASTATAELVMAGNEQFRKRASDAASAGIEQEIARIAMLPAIAGVATHTAPVTAFGASATDSYSGNTVYVGVETTLPQSSADKLVGYQYEIQSSGTSLRGTADSQTQGVMVVAPANGVGTFGETGTGLTGVTGQ